MTWAIVRLRGEDWKIRSDAARHLEERNIIWRDYDCEQNARDNGFEDGTTCWGVYGPSESDEEATNVEIVEMYAVR